jgi:hypothetical protein
MGVPTSEVGYTSAATGRGDHQVQDGHVVALDLYIYIYIYIYIYVCGPTSVNAECRLFLFAEKWYNTESMQKVFLCHSYV